MRRLHIKVIDKQHERFGDVWRFRVQAESGGEQIKFEILCPNHELDQKKLDEINEMFANSLRICKHAGGFFDENTKEEDAKGMLDKWSTTLTGIAIKVGDDKMPEFERFTL